MVGKKIAAHERLLAAAEQELIKNDGHMEISAVAKRAGASAGLTYHHFGSKTGLVAAVVDRFYEPLRDILLGDAISADLAWRERERARTSAMIDYFYEHPLAPLIAGRLAREPEVLDIERSHMQALLSHGARNIAQGQKLGLICPELDPDIVVAMLMGGIRLAIDQALLDDNPPTKIELLNQLWQLISNTLQLEPIGDQ
ncbi:TetR/AcrR family transcriptional regulator [Ancylobacter aquaticus]|uniref:TetR family transcriptional regulator n=3 Tax=Xanthobacteraceae TaxID=335928 RepID=A0A168S631_XANAU|nr:MULTISPECIES: TetR/AcrR family transcriptional regulator [Xanthobacteraceae]ANC67839.1 TetR family transcriptional regulator [Ancylobacter novellus]ANC67904.1 TetR family transcriptional regulator [Xanthobacter autotrophicus]ANC67929.1 TetR family transcriptional regulator [Xanthobacter flavus]RTL87450.1 TetR/AcrR family transcriptional regulator [Ancylobacter aquaticus]